MSNSQKIGILYVDDESLALKYFSEMFHNRVPIFTAQTPEAGLDLFRQHQEEIGIVLSDKNMPGMTGFELLKQVRDINDSPLRILVTAHKDLAEAVDSLNEGLLDSYLTKPWEPDELFTQLQKKLDLYWIKKQRTQILKDRNTVFQEMLMTEKVSDFQSMSHGFSQEISKSIGAIRSYFDSIPLQLNQETGGKPPQDSFFWSEYYSSITSQIDRLESIFGGLSELSTADQANIGSAIKFESGINIASLISEVGSAQTSKHLEVSFAVRGEIQREIEGNTEKLLRLFSSLYRESITNIGERGKGKIDIIIEEEAHSDGSPGLSIYFNDDGQLLDKKQKRHLFDPFFLRSDSTPEFNLFACYIIAYQHGGFIEGNKISGLQYNSIHLWLPLSRRQHAKNEQSKNFLDSLI